MTPDPHPASSGGPAGEAVLRPAATLMLVRDGAHHEAPLEVLLVRRNLRSDFVGGAYVFPGGGVDPDDGSDRAASCSSGQDDAGASRILEVPAGGLAYWVATVRECFEEAGVLLAYGDPPGTALVSYGSPAAGERFARLRAEVNAGRRRFVDACCQEGIALALDRVHYFAHWVTPQGAPRRYDTRFFVAEAPPGQDAAHDEGETVASAWLRPAEALDRFRAGEIELIFPTIRTLQAIGRFATAGELVGAAAAAGRVPATLPRVVVDGRGVRIPLPGDPGYEAAAGAQASAAATAPATRSSRRAVHPEVSTTGATSSATVRASPANTPASSPSPRATGSPASPPAAMDGWSGMDPTSGTPSSAASRAPPPDPKRE